MPSSFAPLAIVVTALLQFQGFVCLYSDYNEIYGLRWTNGAEIDRLNPNNNWENDETVFVLDYAPNGVNAYGDIFVAFSDNTNTQTTTKFATLLGPLESQRNDSNWDQTYLWIFSWNSINNTKNSTQGFTIPNGTTLTALYASNNTKCLLNGGNNNVNNNKNEIVLIGVLQHTNSQLMEIITINATTGNIINTLMKIDDTRISKNMMDFQSDVSAFSNTLCNLDILRKQTMVHIDLNTVSYGLYNQSSSVTGTKVAMWYGSLLNNNNNNNQDDDRLLVLYSDEKTSGYKRLTSIQEINFDGSKSSKKSEMSVLRDSYMGYFSLSMNCNITSSPVYQGDGYVFTYYNNYIYYYGNNGYYDDPPYYFSVFGAISNGSECIIGPTYQQEHQSINQYFAFTVARL